MENKNILEMKGISKAFQGNQALLDVDFALRTGEIHALMGENGAGKSTLMKILLGIYQMDAGTVVYKGSEVRFRSPADGLNSGISMIHQEISLIPQMTVAENIWLRREHLFSRMGVISPSKREKMAKELIDTLGINISPNTKVMYLTVAQMQLVELVRAVSLYPSVIIMDEPTSALSKREIEILYTIVRNLAKNGISIIFISHKLDEIFSICDRVTVLRDGKLIGTYLCGELDNAKLIHMIAGRELTVTERELVPLGNKVFEVEDLKGETFTDVSFSVQQGEVLGFYGLMGAGRSEIVRAVYGIDKHTGGKIRLRGKEITVNQPKDSVVKGIGMVTEDRLRMGCFFNFSVMNNVTIAVFRRICNWFGISSKKREKRRFDTAIDRLRIKYDSPQTKIGLLSGGNQQKAIIARWLATESSVLILDEPTRGIDVGSKTEIYDLIGELARSGVAIILISSELPEILALCDRINVVKDGQIVFTCGRNEANQELLVKYAFGINNMEENTQ
jgi:ABC-type sugar transport system ATPase subunit